MSRGPYTQPQGAPAGLTLTDQIIWKRPEEDGLDDYYTEHYDERGWLVPTLTRATMPANRDQLPSGDEALLVTQRTPGADPPPLSGLSRACAPLHPPA